MVIIDLGITKILCNDIIEGRNDKMIKMKKDKINDKKENLFDTYNHKMSLVVIRSKNNTNNNRRSKRW